jgi:hypothetical protein
LTTEERLEQTPDTTLTDLLLREEEKHESASCFWFQVPVFYSWILLPRVVVLPTFCSKNLNNLLALNEPFLPIKLLL